MNDFKSAGDVLVLRLQSCLAYLQRIVEIRLCIAVTALLVVKQTEVVEAPCGPPMLAAVPLYPDVECVLDLEQWFAYIEVLTAVIDSKVIEAHREDRDELLAAGRRPVTVNGLVRKILAKPFREARAKGLIQIDPVAGMKAIWDTRIQKETFTLEQIERLIKTAEGDWPGMVIAGYFTGARLSDLANLKWNNIDLA